MTASAYPRVIGITEDITVCDCCGRAGLKRTVELDLGDEHVWYGTTCASKAFPRLGSAADVARSASQRCCCGCGEFATIGTASGRLYARPCWERARASRVALSA